MASSKLCISRRPLFSFAAMRCPACIHIHYIDVWCRQPLTSSPCPHMSITPWSACRLSPQCHLRPSGVLSVLPGPAWAGVQDQGQECRTAGVVRVPYLGTARVRVTNFVCSGFIIMWSSSVRPSVRPETIPYRTIPYNFCLRRT